jgi:hypothetical protein
MVNDQDKPHETIIERPWFDAESFLAESGLLQRWAREGFECSIRSALEQAGFQSRRLRRIPEHQLIIADGDRPLNEEFQQARLVKARVLRAFRERGLAVRPEFYCLRGGRTKLSVSVGIFETVS